MHGAQLRSTCSKILPFDKVFITSTRASFVSWKRADPQSFTDKDLLHQRMRSRGPSRSNRVTATFPPPSCPRSLKNQSSLTFRRARDIGFSVEHGIPSIFAFHPR